VWVSVGKCIWYENHAPASNSLRFSTFLPILFASLTQPPFCIIMSTTLTDSWPFCSDVLLNTIQQINRLELDWKGCLLGKRLTYTWPTFIIGLTFIMLSTGWAGATVECYGLMDWSLLEAKPCLCRSLLSFTRILSVRARDTLTKRWPYYLGPGHSASQHTLLVFKRNIHSELVLSLWCI